MRDFIAALFCFTSGMLVGAVSTFALNPLSPITVDPDGCPAPVDVFDKGDVLSGVVVRVIDGDSICIARDNGLLEIRLANVNAPEWNKPGGSEAREALKASYYGNTVTCTASHVSYDRLVATCVLKDPVL